MAQPSDVPLATPLAVISPQYCVAHPVELAIVKEFKAFGRGTFVVTDANGNIIFEVKPVILFFNTSRRVIVDAAGNPIVTSKPKAISSPSRWRVFRGESTDSRDLLFSAKRDSMFQWKTKLDVFFAHNTVEKVCDVKIDAGRHAKSCVICAGDSSTVIAKMHKKRTAQSFFFRKDNFTVTVSPNADYAFIVALIVILDEISKPASSSSGAAASMSSASG